MDFNALQHKLFALDPTDPAEDFKKLTAQATGETPAVPPTKDFLNESAEVTEGTLEIDRDYSVSDFAALAGVKVDEAPSMAAGINAAKTAMKSKGNAQQMTKALDQVAQGKTVTSNLSAQIAPFAKQLQTILSNPQLKSKFIQLIKQAEQMSQPAAQPAAQAVNKESIKAELLKRLQDSYNK